MLAWLIEKLPAVKRLRTEHGQLTEELVRARTLIQHLQDRYRAEVARNLRTEGFSADASENRAKVLVEGVMWTAAKPLTAAGYGPLIEGPVDIDIGAALDKVRQRLQESGQ